MRAAFVLFVVAACGGEAEPAPHPGDPRAGFVRCGERECDVGSGNQCFTCAATDAPRCMTLDLPVPCDERVAVLYLCDGNEDCKGGRVCFEDIRGRSCR